MADEDLQRARNAVANAVRGVEKCTAAVTCFEEKIAEIESDRDNFEAYGSLYKILIDQLLKAKNDLEESKEDLANANKNLEIQEEIYHLELLTQIPVNNETKPSSKKSNLVKRNLENIRTVEEISLDTATPSLLARSGGRKYLKKNRCEIDCHRTSFDSMSLPITLMHPVFAEFVQNYATIRPNSECCLFAHNFRQEILKDYNSVADMADTVRYHLGNFMGVEIPIATVNASVSDGSLRINGILILNIQVKVHPGLGGDPVMENLAYYMKLLPKSVNKQLPCFLLDISGPVLGIYGVMNTDKYHVICEPLCPGIMLHDVQNQLIRPMVPRAFAALKISIQNLQTMTVTNNMAGLTSFPYKTSCQIDGADVTFRYIENITRQVFLVEYNRTDDKTCKAVAKFTSQYAREVHEYSANCGFAPKLIAFEELPAGWKFVLMEYIELESITKMDRVVKEQQINSILQSLRREHFVHGDFRPTNVLWNRLQDKVFVIDFDWSGKNGIERYPMDINPDVGWPPGVTTNEVLMFEHDTFWIGTLLESQI